MQMWKIYSKFDAYQQALRLQVDGHRVSCKKEMMGINKYHDAIFQDRSNISPVANPPLSQLLSCFSCFSCLSLLFMYLNLTFRPGYASVA